MSTTPHHVEQMHSPEVICGIDIALIEDAVDRILEEFRDNLGGPFEGDCLICACCLSLCHFGGVNLRTDEAVYGR